MRKLLLGTTAVVGAALIGATGAAAQEAPTVRIGGYFDFSIGYISDNAERGYGVRPNRFDYRTDAEVHVLVQGKAANGLTYGARVEFEMDAAELGGAGTSPGVTTDEIWGFVSSPTLGTLRFGDTDSAAGIMQVRPPRYTGFHGPALNWVRHGGNRHQLTGINFGADNTKVVYMSPQFAGFDFGLSFALNGAEGERATISGAEGDANLQRGRSTRENELTGALRYRGTFGGVGIAAGFAFSSARAPAANATGGSITRVQNPTAYSFGLTATFQGFTLGGEYTWGRFTGFGAGNNGTPQGLGDSRHFLLGASYAIPGAGVTLTGNFGRGSQPTTTAGRAHTSRTFGAGATYTLAPGWSLYAYYENQRDRNYSNNGVLAVPPGSGAAPGAPRSISAFVLGTTLTF